MKSRNSVLNQHSATLIDNLIGVFIMIVDAVFFIAAPIAGILVVFLALCIPFILYTYIPVGEGYIFVPFICSPPLGILLGFYTLKKINQKMTMGRRQKNMALAIKASVGIVAAVFIICLIFAAKAHYENLGSMIIVSVVVSIFSVFVDWFIYRYLNQSNV